MSTHHVSEVEGLADHLGLLQRGELRLQITRDALHDQLHLYEVDVAPGWQIPHPLAATVAADVAHGRERALTLWGAEPEISRLLVQSGATIRQTRPLSMSDAARVLLGHTLGNSNGN